MKCGGLQFPDPDYDNADVDNHQQGEEQSGENRKAAHFLSNVVSAVREVLFDPFEAR
jgi:hypothetical protein